MPGSLWQRDQRVDPARDRSEANRGRDLCPVKWKDQPLVPYGLFITAADETAAGEFDKKLRAALERR